MFLNGTILPFFGHVNTIQSKNYRPSYEKTIPSTIYFTVTINSL